MKKLVKFEDRTPEEITEIYNMIGDEITKCLSIIQKKTGYYTTGQFMLYSDVPKKCMDINLDISLLEIPHEVDIDKMEYYEKVNPDNCLNETIHAYKHNSWYMIYNGVHRFSANRELGNKTIKANIVVPSPKDLDK